MAKIYRSLKRCFKKNTHNRFLGAIAAFGITWNRFYENRNHDIYSNGELVVLKKLSKFKPKVIFDVGANIGAYSEAVNKTCPDAQIYAFEPVKDTFKLLEENLKDKDSVKIFNNGISDKKQTVEFQIYPSNTHSSIFKIHGAPDNQGKISKVNLIKGDDFMKENNIDFIDLLKIDTEGAEMDVLQGFREAFKNKQIGLVQFEYGYINITSKKLLVDFYEFFEEFGYHVGKIYPKRVDFREYKILHEDFIGPNFLAIHPDKVDLKKVLSKR